MRFYTVAIVSLAIDAPVKWTDNILSHHEIAEVVAEKRGIARRIPHRALLRLALIRQLQQEVGVGAREAVTISATLLGAGAREVRVGSSVSLRLDVPSLEQLVAVRLQAALESAPAPRRGRPRGRATPPGDAT